MKIAFLGDTHFCTGNENVDKYQQKFFDNIFFPYITQHNIKTVLQFGDSLDNRKHVNIVGLEYANNMFFKHFTNDLQLITLLGNHDIAKKNTLFPNSPSHCIDSKYNVQIIDSPTEWNDMLIIPWICQENEQYVFDKIASTKCKILCGHLELVGYKMSKDVVIEHGMDAKLFKKFDRVFSGHYHISNMITKNGKYIGTEEGSNINYLGIPYQLTFNDVEDVKGFWIYDTETLETEFVENPYRFFHKFEYNDGYDYDLEQLVDTNVRIIVRSKSDAMLYEKFLQDVDNMNPLSVKYVDNFEDIIDGKIDIDKMDLSDTLSLLHKYIDVSETNVDKDSVKKYLNEIYTDAVVLL